MEDSAARFKVLGKVLQDEPILQPIILFYIRSINIQAHSYNLLLDIYIF